MKTAIVLTILMAVSSTSYAWIEKAPAQKAYDFKYKLKNDTFKYSRSAASYEEAFEHAATACFKHFKNGKRLSETEGLDIIDVCANPRS
ncbi:hypothetical protein [Bdellovibrio sp. HCB337]|uniref:hypothetical protein n=1 Tax=Bdellovibrio sp. HCB337 TaxID=3394358 RepID=UPI0039A66F09